MSAKEIATLVVNALIIIGLFVGVCLNKITWPQALGVLGALLVPSAAELGANRLSAASAAKVNKT